jgi:hypothetical protein
MISAIHLSRDMIRDVTVPTNIRVSWISITDPTNTHPIRDDSPFFDVLKIKFVDIDGFDFNWDINRFGPILNKDISNQMADFIINSVNNGVQCFLVNCDAGVARSAGVTAAIINFFTGCFPCTIDSFSCHNRRVRFMLIDALRSKAPQLENIFTPSSNMNITKNTLFHLSKSQAFMALGAWKNFDLFGVDIKDIDIDLVSSPLDTWMDDIGDIHPKFTLDPNNKKRILVNMTAHDGTWDTKRSILRAIALFVFNNFPRNRLSLWDDITHDQDINPVTAFLDEFVDAVLDKYKIHMISSGDMFDIFLNKLKS